MQFLEFLKAIVLGIVEGITEWLPISSTGHLLLTEQFMPLNTSAQFKEMFNVVIQLGAIMAVVVLYFHKLNPFSPKKTKEEKHGTLKLWGKVLLACIPAAVIGLPLDNWFDAHFYNPLSISVMLILYGILFILVENWNKKRTPRIRNLQSLDYMTALMVGLFQCLSLMPGTSRSGATILGAILIGTSRSVAAEFTFFLAIPAMIGASGYKVVKFAKAGVAITGTEIIILLIGTVVAFFVSIWAIRFLMRYIKSHDFKAFGWYRIALGILILILCASGVMQWLGK